MQPIRTLVTRVATGKMSPGISIFFPGSIKLLIRLYKRFVQAKRRKKRQEKVLKWIKFQNFIFTVTKKKKKVKTRH